MGNFIGGYLSTFFMFKIARSVSDKISISDVSSPLLAGQVVESGMIFGSEISPTRSSNVNIVWCFTYHCVKLNIVLYLTLCR